MLVAEDVHVGVLGKVGGQPDDLGTLLGELRQRMAERGLCGPLSGIGEGGDHRRGRQALLLRGCGGAHGCNSWNGGLGGVREGGRHRAKVSSSWARATSHSCSSTRMKCAFSRSISSGTPEPMRVSQMITDGAPVWLVAASKAATRAGRLLPSTR